MAQKELDALKQKGIQVGDYVSLPWLGGRAGGLVKKIALTEEDTPHPPKVIFVSDHTGNDVSHNPSTLTVDPSRSERPGSTKNTDEDAVEEGITDEEEE